MTRVSLKQVIARYSAGFGYVAANILVAGANNRWSDSVDIPVFETTSARFADVVFSSNNLKRSFAFGDSGITDTEFELKHIGPALMVSFSRDKNVVLTPIDRSEIEVIEYFGLKPFDIRIQGILIDQDEHQYPKVLVRSLNELFSAPGTFKVKGEIFLDLGITEVFFESGFSIDFVEGYADTVKFSVNARSTQPAEFKTVGY